MNTTAHRTQNTAIKRLNFSFLFIIGLISSSFAQVLIGQEYIATKSTKSIKTICVPESELCNLVMNGDFEQYLDLPMGTTQLYKACGWEGSHSSTELFATESLAPTVQIPCNQLGYQNVATTGNNYAGFGFWQNTSIPNYFNSEIIKTRLNSPLLPNTTYKISFQISLADTYNQYATRIQTYLSTTNITVPSGTTMPIANPSMLFTNSTYITDSDDWRTVTFTFTTTTGGEQYLYIGSLNYSGLTDTTRLIPNPAATAPNPSLCGPSHFQVFGSNYATYNYIDNIKLEEQKIPNFNFATTICPGVAVPTLPTTSTNGITGTWNPSTINPTASASYTFTPTIGQCAETKVVPIVVSACLPVSISSKVVGGFFCYKSIAQATSQTTGSSVFDAINGGTGMPATIGGVPCSASNVGIYNITPIYPTTLNPNFTLNPNGTTTILGNTTPFDQRFTFDLCPLGNSSSASCVRDIICDVGITNMMNPLPDTLTMNTSGDICSSCPTNVLTNDLLYGCPNTELATTTNCVVTQITIPPYTSYPFLWIDNLTGDIKSGFTVPMPTMPAGVYEPPHYKLAYKICDINNPTVICRTQEVTVYMVNSFRMANITSKMNSNLFDLKSLVIAPNPSDGNFVLQFNTLIDKPANLEIYNLLGQQVYTEIFANTKEHQLFLKHLQAGTYLLKISVAGEIVTKKIVIR